MKANTIDGDDIRNWFKFGLLEVEKNKKHINEINVFPIADGDTGTNLVATIKAMAERNSFTKSYGDMIERMSESGLAHARGNSGIIFASYVNGLAEESKTFETVDLSQFSKAAHGAVSYIYKAIENPVEGTMISVIKDWALFLFNNHSRFESFEALLAEAYDFAKISLSETTQKLEILKKNNVVDSGAEGFVRFLKGINSIFKQDKIDAFKDDLDEIREYKILDEINSKFRYCSEILIKNNNAFKEDLRNQLELLGDSIIISSHNDKTRFHLHTNYPAEMAQVVKEYGEIIEQKVDDIHLQQKIINHKLSRIAILTDSIADITDEIMLKYQIHFVPLTLILDDVSYLDKRTIDNKILFELIKGAKAYPTSSQPEPGSVKEKLEYLLENYDSIIAVTVSEKLSGTYATFKREADKLAKNGKKITVINSKLNSGAQGIIVKKAAELIVDGVSHEDIVKQIKDMIPRTKIYVCLETIENAVRGGRVSNRVGKIGIAIGARPIMTIDQNGKGATFAMGFSQKGLTKKIFSIARKINASKGIESYSIVHVENTSLAKIYEDYLFKLTGKKAEFVTTISSVTSIHSGLGSVAISVVEK